MSLLRALPLLVAGLWPTLHAAPLETDHLRSQLVADRSAAVPGESLRLGLLFDHDPNWHTYWVNPGDSGLATRVTLELPDGVVAHAIDWPAPKRYQVADIVNYGYGDVALLPIRIEVPAGYAAATLDIRAQASWLICEIECIPGRGEYTLSLPVAARADADPRWQAAFDWADGRQPQPADDLQLRVALDGEDIVLDFAGAVPDAPERWQLFPVTAQVVANPAAPRWQGTQARWQQSEFFAGLPASVELVIATGDDRFLSVRGPTVDAALLGAAAPAPAAPAAGGSPTTLALALGLALLGGLILNLMPCVFPVLSIKAMGALESADDRAALRSHGLWYTAGVVLSFLAIAAVLIALRAGGEQLGWGFQLQSPAFIAGIALLLFAMALSFSGVWEFGGRLAGVGQQLTEGHGARSAFFTGVLATVVASPCTAPFMGTALGFALAQPPVAALAVFAALGLGLALPMLLLGFVPGLARVLPRPGPWMAGFRQLLAFPLYLTVVWLLWVYGEQTSPLGMAWLMAALVSLAFALWLLGRRRAQRSPTLRAASGVAALAALAFALAWPIIAEPPQQAAAAAADHEPWSAEALAAHRAAGRPVLVNMTAAWCITCLANERVALSSASVRTALAERGIVYMKGDWTRHDDAITRYLESYGRNGVPLYVLYPGGGAAPTVLPQLLTPDLVIDALSAIPRRD